MSEEAKRIRYIIEPSYKKSACEEQSWSNTLKNGKSVIVKVCNVYRWGKFYIDLTQEEKKEILTKEMVNLSEYEFELIEMWDGGCDFWVDIDEEDTFTEEEQEEIDRLLYYWPEDNVPEDEDAEDDGYDEEKMEANGWIECDCDYVLSSACELQVVTDEMEELI
jgi:hypothetical protein